MTAGTDGADLARSSLASAVERLDAVAFDLDDDADAGRASIDDYESAFAQARAANAALAALDPDPCRGVMEALYEAAAADGGIEDLRVTIESVL